MPRTFNNDDYQVSKFLNNILLNEVEANLTRDNMFSLNVFTRSVVQNITVPPQSVLTETQFQPGASAIFIASGAAAHTITPGVGVLINGSASALTFSATPFNTSITLLRIDGDIWSAVQTVAVGSSASTSLRGVIVNISAAKSLATSSSGIDFPWDVAAYDTDGFWDIGEPELLTIPLESDIRWIELRAGILFGAPFDAPAGLRFRVGNQTVPLSTALPGGGYDKRWGRSRTGVGATDNVGMTVTSAPIAVLPGDHFTAFVLQNSGGNIDILSGTSHTFLSLRVLGVS